jgi:FlaG/FlaF family flagellin (archaellin)
MSTAKHNERGTAVLIALMLLLALTGILAATTRFGHSVAEQLKLQESRHNEAFRTRLES